VGHEQPLYPAAQVADGFGPNPEVEVMGHHAVTEEIRGKPDAGVTDRLDKGVIVAGLGEDRLAAMAAIEHVIPHVADRGSGGSRYQVMVTSY
jgi:hypothetical protein